MSYQPIIRYTVNDKPYLQIDLAGIPPKLQDEFIGSIHAVLQTYHTSHQRTTDWLQRADELNAEWQSKREISDLGMKLATSGKP